MMLCFIAAARLRPKTAPPLLTGEVTSATDVDKVLHSKCLFKEATNFFSSLVCMISDGLKSRYGRWSAVFFVCRALFESGSLWRGLSSMPSCTFIANWFWIVLNSLFCCFFGEISVMPPRPKLDLIRYSAATLGVFRWNSCGREKLGCTQADVLHTDQIKFSCAA